MARREKGTAGAEKGESGSFGELEVLLGHRFRKPELLQVALTHRSFVYDAAVSEAKGNLADPSQDNEQLEFVGDAVLGLLAAEGLCRRFPGLREGELTRLRSSVVSRKHLGEVGARLGLGRWLRLGHTAERNAGRTNAALWANAVEAVIAALYLDGGINVARRFVEERVLAGALPSLEGGSTSANRINGVVGDYKSALQELLQAEGRGRPQYRLVGQTGPDHRRMFQVEVRLEEAGEALGAAERSTKKQAEQVAARLALESLTVGEIGSDGGE